MWTDEVTTLLFENEKGGALGPAPADRFVFRAFAGIHVGCSERSSGTALETSAGGAWDCSGRRAEILCFLDAEKYANVFHLAAVLHSCIPMRFDDYKLRRRDVW